MGLGRELAYASLRISLGIPTTESDIDLAAQTILKVLRQMRETGQLWAFAQQGDLPDLSGWHHPDLA